MNGLFAKLQALIALVMLCCWMAAAQAELFDRGNNLIYDSDLDITWYDNSHPASNWSDAQNWAEALNYAGFDDWRLPNGPTDPNYQFFNSCRFKPYFDPDPTTNDRGWWKANGELGHLFYEELGGIGFYQETFFPDDQCTLANEVHGLVNGPGPFQNLIPGGYWTVTPAFGGAHYWNFHLDSGGQGTAYNGASSEYAMAVRDGDVVTNPTTFEDCKKNGWRNYGFRNQGQCLRFLNTGVDSR